MKTLRVGKLYKGLFTTALQNASPNFIFQVVDVDYEHHKGYYEFRIIPIIPDHFHFLSTSAYGEEKSSEALWVRSMHIGDCEELPDNHPAYVLYAKKIT